MAATQVYYSVGQNTNNHAASTSPLTVTISGGTATFSEAQTASNMGIGDKVTYNTSSIAFIAGKISGTQWRLITPTGGIPSNASGASVSSITHAFASLKAAVGTGITGNATSSSFLNTSDLVVGDYQLNIPVYYDSGPDTSALIIAGFTADLTHYVRIYTPTSTDSEVNQSQRHGGRWTSTAWRMDSNFNFSQPILSRQPYMRYDGLQLRNTTSNGVAYAIDSEVAGGAENMYLSHSIIMTSGDKWTCVKLGLGGAGYSFHIWNNFFVNCATGIYAGVNVYGASQLYSNTFYDTVTGVSFTGSGTASFKAVNNLVASSTYPFSPGGRVLAGSDYNSVNASTTGLSVTGGFGGHDRVSQASSFVDAGNIDLHLLSSDTSALDLGVSLAGDSMLPVADDIDSDARPYGSAFDIGADEYNGATGDVTPPILSAGSPSGTIATSTTSALITVTTSENATCKYDTVAGTAYASMPNTFATTGGISHSQTIGGLSSGHSYAYYVRCIDGAGNPDIGDYIVSFGVATNGVAYASSCVATAVNTAISLAITGDTVQLPSCNVSDTWGSTTATVTVNKQVTLQGNGTSSTAILAGPGTALSITASQAAIQDFTMRIGTTTTPIFVSIGGSVDRWRMSGMLLDQEGVPLSNIGSNYLVYVSNQMTTTNTYGLIYGNRFDGVVGEVFFWRGPCNSWDTANSYGQANALFLEGNTFTSTSTAYIDTNANGRLVARYNDLTKIYFDGHGMNTNTDQCASEHHAGVRTEEIYNNRFISPGYTSVYVRGGSALIYNNTVEATSSNLFGSVWMQQLELTNPGVGNLSIYFPVVGYACKTDYPIVYQIGRGLNSVAGPSTGSQQASEPLFIWNNTYAPYGTGISTGYGYSNGAASPAVRAACGDPALQVSDVVVQDRDFCSHDTSTTCNGYDLTSYSAYSCPHPLASLSGSCNPALSGVAGYDIAGYAVRPTVASSAVTVGTTTATLNGSITATGGSDATQSGFVWGSFSSSLNGGDTATTTLGSQSGTVSLSSPLAGLSCNTRYYIRPYATNSAGTGYGAITSFTTRACAAVVNTGDAAFVSASGATLNGSVSDTGGSDASQSGFAYGSDPSLRAGVSTTTEGIQTGLAAFTRILSNLSCGAVYYTRAYVTTIAGDSFGSIQTFATAGCPANSDPSDPVVQNPTLGIGSGPSIYTRPLYKAQVESERAVAALVPMIRSAGLGSSGEHVKAIQATLNTLGFRVAPYGVGSPGKETSFFGPLTRKAVQAFQLYHQVATPRDVGFGYVGPKTRAVFQRLAGTSR